ncbi:Mannose-1-phosphate guanyltransferase beta-A [Thelohanellus kitauei]|uniref:mannose-1-phosphate guanylyltransferase n=1 Tax=Thelohanellus kitauei TaxID=669202 RepID=A0A0C2M4Q0_THEKT|nr:Mannose-1-phosphate guanyltransferase beta-A [Thelohanellus kitauei]
MTKALILAGGYGTRLRPLTLTRPKPLVEFCNKPILFHQIDALVQAGVTEIVLAVSYMCDMLKKEVDVYSRKRGVDVVFSKEDEPLGTGGPLALAKEYLKGDKPFFVLNSDVICDYPFKEMMTHHLIVGAEGTIAVVKVDDPSKYGVVVSDETSKILQFVEKPKDFISNKINAGIYLLNPSVLDRIPLRPVSIEKETFPQMALDQTLYCFRLQSFWMDIGQPHDYLMGSKLYLQHLKLNNPKNLGHCSFEHKNGLIHNTVTFGDGCFIGENVVIGHDCKIGEGVHLDNCVILSNTTIKSHGYIDNSLIGWRCTIGEWARIQNCSVLGENVVVQDEVLINGCKVLPQKCISESLYTSKIIM